MAFRNRRITGGGASSRYREGPPRRGMPDYRQLDGYSCGFIAALTVVHRFRPEVPPIDLLRIVKPGLGGCDSDRMIRSLRRFGITARYLSGIRQRRLGRFLEEEAVPVVTVWPWDWGSDHWTVVRSVTEDRVFFTNYGSHIKGMDWWAFRQVWYPKGGAIVCEER